MSSLVQNRTRCLRPSSTSLENGLSLNFMILPEAVAGLCNPFQSDGLGATAGGAMVGRGRARTDAGARTASQWSRHQAAE